MFYRPNWKAAGAFVYAVSLRRHSVSLCLLGYFISFVLLQRVSYLQHTEYSIPDFCKDIVGYGWTVSCIAYYWDNGFYDKPYYDCYQQQKKEQSECTVKDSVEFFDFRLFGEVFWQNIEKGCNFVHGLTSFSILCAVAFPCLYVVAAVKVDSYWRIMNSCFEFLSFVPDFDLASGAWGNVSDSDDRSSQHDVKASIARTIGDLRSFVLF